MRTSRRVVALIAGIVLCTGANATPVRFELALATQSGGATLSGEFSIDETLALQPIFANVSSRPLANFAIASARGEVFTPDDAAQLARAFYVDGELSGLDLLVTDLSDPLGAGAVLDIATGFACPAGICEVISRQWTLRSSPTSGAGGYAFMRRVPAPATLALLMVALGLLVVPAALRRR